MVVADDDAVDHVQPEACPLADTFGREEGLEDSGEHLRRDAGAAVSDLDHNPVLLVGCADPELAGAGHGVDRVVDQVGPDLV